MLVNISDAVPRDTLISRPQILKNPHDIYPDTGGNRVETSCPRECGSRCVDICVRLRHRSLPHPTVDVDTVTP